MQLAQAVLVPVDVKKRDTSPGGQAYPSHMAQVLAYCLLVEDQYDCQVPYGVIDYRDRSVQIPFDRNSWEWILGLVADRDHQHRQRCRACGYRLPRWSCLYQEEDAEYLYPQGSTVSEGTAADMPRSVMQDVCRVAVGQNVVKRPNRFWR